jgi:hypothetical protein
VKQQHHGGNDLLKLLAVSVFSIGLATSAMAANSNNGGSNSGDSGGNSSSGANGSSGSRRLAIILSGEDPCRLAGPL